MYLLIHTFVFLCQRGTMKIAITKAKKTIMIRDIPW